MPARMATRMADVMKQAVEAQAASLGITQSEFVREAVAAHLAWHRALDAVDAGHTTENLRNPIYVSGPRPR